ncbi:hypothetical protein B0G93_11045 [Bacillus sp. V-88]|nr:hypothetical protein B1B00_11550 [Bacillus sp. DSM 27956]PRX76093.1 hypothetical protein B0G93_11045 [Bacillus sp. V-88]SLK23140.1 hypothetical protein SAMN06295884_11045 [Bacillus sp. V-88]
MIRKLLFLLLVISIMGACSQQETEENPTEGKNFTLEEVETIITDQGIELDKETDLPSENVFIQELNGITPEVYNAKSHTLSVNDFSSAGDREKGFQRFEENTATAEVVEHRAYQLNNILVFYISDDEKMQNRLFEALEELDASE